MMRFDVDLQKCVACAACTVACMDQNDTDIRRGELPLRYMYQLETQSDDGTWHVVYMSAACMHCPDCASMRVCPTKCFSRDETTGLVRLDTSECIRCGRCVRACVFSAIRRYDDKSIHKCDGCLERVQNGLSPACVRACPTGALRLFAGDTDLTEDRSLYAHPEILRKARKWE